MILTLELVAFGECRHGHGRVEEVVGFADRSGNPSEESVEVGLGKSKCRPDQQSFIQGVN